MSSKRRTVTLTGVPTSATRFNTCPPETPPDSSTPLKGSDTLRTRVRTNSITATKRLFVRAV